MKKYKVGIGYKRLIFAGALKVVLGIAYSATALSADWTGYNLHSDGYPNTVAMQKFADLTAERSQGRLKMNISNGSKVSQPDAINMVIENEIQVANFNLGPLGQIAPAANVVSLPFIFKDTGHMYRAMDGEAGDIISADLEKHGIVALSYFDAGARSFYNNKWPVNSPDDIEGLTIRVMGNDLYSGMIDAMGGTPKKIAFPAVLSALQTGTVDGAENNLPSYESTEHYTVAGYLSDSQHLIIPECICMSADLFNSLSAADQDMLKVAARESAELQRTLWVERSKRSLEKVMANGVKFNKVSEKRAFQTAMRPLYGKYLRVNPELAPLVDLIREID